MHRYRRNIFFFLLVFISFVTSGQQTGTPKSLLWRISGHGLQKPSYLYGTMHLTDKRLFQFGDSVYHAIEQSEGLAIEVNPDELAAYYVNRLFDQMENSRKLDEILKPGDFKKYSASLSKKFNKPAADITARDIVKEKNKWMQEYMEKGEMPTFVDAYLYNIARRQGKWLGGIEDITDQSGLMEDLVDKSDIEYMLAGNSTESLQETNKGMERMIKLYTDQDIDGIEAFSDDTEPAEKKDRMLIRRNIKMARRIDSLTSIRTMFLAIGAAHLPGDEGVIDLLRKRGFTVEPVFSSRKINEKEYTFKEISIPWYPIDDSQGLYHCSMPGNPATVKLFGLIEMKFLMDIFNMAGYCTMAIPTAADFSASDSAYNELARHMLQTNQVPAAKIVYRDGIEGREYIQEKKAANLRLQIFAYKKVVYISLMYATKPAFMHTEYADKFFGSLVINKKAITASSSVFTDSVMGISFTAPAMMTYNKKLSKLDDPGWKMSTFTGTDLSNGSYIMLFSKEVKPGHYLPADSLINKDFDANMSKQYTLLRHEDIMIQGHPAIKITGKNILQSSVYMTALTMIQNGRNIVLMAIADSEHLHAPAIEHIFESLQLVPHPPRSWQLYSSPDGRFNSQGASAIQSYFNSTDKREQFYTYDTTTSVTYSIIPDTLDKYFWAKDDSSYWKDRIAYNLETDSLVQQMKIQNGPLQGVELLTKEYKNKTRYKRIRLLLDGNILYKLFVSAEKDFLYNNHTNDFFNDFRINTTSKDQLFYLHSKAALLLQDAAAKDSATRYNAYMALLAAHFTEEDRQLLQEALFKEYGSWYDSSLSDMVNNQIAIKLATLNNNETVAFVKSRYASFSERKDTLKNIALTVLTHLHTKESYDALAQLLLQPLPQKGFSYHIADGFRDSLALTASIYPSLQKLAGDTLYTGRIAGIANELLDSGLIKLNEVKQAESAFVKSAGLLQPALLRGQAVDYNVYQLLHLLGRFNTTAANAMLTNYLRVKSSWFKQAAAMELIKNNQPTPIAALNSLAADKASRAALYTKLKDIHKAKLFPQQWLSRQNFAESAVYDAATDEDYDENEYTGMAFLYKKTALYKNKTYVFYLYKTTYKGEDGPLTYLGIAGGYKPVEAGVEPEIDISGIYRQEALTGKNAAVLLKAYLEQMEKDAASVSEE